MADILIVDDHPIVAEGLQKLILSKGITQNCVAVYTFQECLKILEIFKPDMILLDYYLPSASLIVFSFTPFACGLKAFASVIIATLTH